ncbi:hypothetical protein MAA5396_04764 [Marinovum algicola]|uniref:Uncharacterized protein n=1 Tax=Marinovum algicola TaxID=42444 RepID=A0A975ZQQ0_9RHOB|nr:hypothetical protein [Marinovum algicola]SEK08230.1 hypothetical protein SAMN04487940_12623 [Marinovum algicola]SLN76588.1 hypothetical protein MAA5396_04764 [Marinovum algicola]
MSIIDKRVKKLEAKRSDGNFVWVRAPSAWSEDRCRSEAKSLLPQDFVWEGCELSIQQSPESEQLDVIFAGSGSELSAILKEVARRGNRITNGRPAAGPDADDLGEGGK